MNLLIRPYQQQDKQALLEIIQLNVPTYFAQDEVDDLAEYLEQYIDLYFVATVDNIIVGAGGINRNFEQKLGALSWGFLHPDYQRQGIGGKLLSHRIKILQQEEGIDTIRVRTSQVVYPFFEKYNFKIIDIQKDYWAKGLDLYEMELIKTESHHA